MVLTLDHTTVRVGSEEDNLVDLWLFANGRLEVETCDPSTFMHCDFWHGEDLEDYYRGRHYPHDNQVDLIPPDRLKHRQIPSVLLYALERKFPGHRLKIIDV